MNESSFDGVKKIVVETLGIADRADALTPESELFGSIPELDSMAVVELAAALEDKFDFVIDDSDFTGDVFETLGTLTAFVDERRSA